MSEQAISRRDILRTLAAGVAGGWGMKVIPAQGGEYAHHIVDKDKKTSASGKYEPKFFSAHAYETVVALCDTIIPKDEHSGGAVEAGAPEFIDLLTSENVEYQASLGGGLAWLATFCTDRYSTVILACTPEQTQEVSA